MFSGADTCSHPPGMSLRGRGRMVELISSLLSQGRRLGAARQIPDQLVDPEPRHREDEHVQETSGPEPRGGAVLKYQQKAVE